MSNLPTLLAGPILRRCSVKEVTIWLAASKHISRLGLTIRDRSTKRPIPLRADVTTIPAAVNLWVHLLRARPLTGDFPAGRILLYDVGMRSAAGEALLPFDGEVDTDLTYDSFQLPSLILQEPGSSRLNVLYGSCRKSHGPGFDAARAADALMNKQAADPAARPHVLLLGGDQIYGDDVPEILIRPIQSLAKALLGFEEPLPDGFHFPNDIPVNGRQAVVRRARLTSGHAANHLMTFGEYCAAYLLAWNPKVWPAEVPTLAETFEHLPEQSQQVLGQLPLELGRQVLSKLLGGVVSVDEYRRGSNAIRRLLANVPTYMTFDDHEVTDDWFLNPRFQASSLASSLGRRIIANGMAAFWLFQAIGNDFDYHYKQSISDALSKHLRVLKVTRAESSSESRNFEKVFTSLRSWDFVTPTQPPAVFLDTRTRRTFSRDERQHTEYTPWNLWLDSVTHDVPRDAPRLFNFQSDRVRALAKQLAGQRASRLILVVPTPVYGLEAIEKVQDFAVNKELMSGAGADFESCHADPNSFLDFVQFLFDLSSHSRLRLVVVLSGDVHYAFSVGALLKNMRTQDPPIPVAQFTSSATKNEAVAGWAETGLAALAIRLAQDAYRIRFWWRKGSDGSAHSSTTAPPLYIAAPGASISFRHWLVKSFHDVFLKKAAGSDLQIAEAFYFTPVSPLSAVELENNMGYLELEGMRVKNRLIRWTGGYKESLKTDWHPYATHGWPVHIRP
jgi:hypothetical protein